MPSLERYTKDRSRIFLLDAQEPRHITLVRRRFGPKKQYEWDCPIGGKIEERESPYAAAVRELAEETGIVGLSLVAFAQVKIGTGRTDYFFRGILDGQNALLPIEGEGALRWQPVEGLLDCPLDPIARVVLQKWVRQQFKTSPPWNVDALPSHINRAVPHIRVVATHRGLR